MITISLKTSGSLVGTISDAELQLLMDQFEEESSTDRDYYVDEQTVQMLEQNGATPALAALLRKAIGNSDGVDIVWARG